jgi:hypothetical protein
MKSEIACSFMVKLGMTTPEKLCPCALVNGATLEQYTKLYNQVFSMDISYADAINKIMDDAKLTTHSVTTTDVMVEQLKAIK